MIPISSSALAGGLVWSKIPHKRRYELKRRGEIVGSLQRMSCWSSEVQAESYHGNWRFRRTGFFRTGTEILDAGANIQVATLKPNCSGGGRLVFSDGQTFRITVKGFWRPVWMVFADNGQPVFSIHSREKTVESPNATHLSEDRLILLVIFTCHIMQQASEDAASAAAVVAATT